jgi:GT2 family glycosyltransferase
MIAIHQHTAVVILSYNSLKWLQLFLPKVVEASTNQYEVVVVDHASTDDTALVIQRDFPEVHLLRLNENHGFAWGYAEALKQIKAKYYVLLSADFEVTHNWYMPLFEMMESHPRLGAIQPKVRYYKEREYFEYAGASGGFMDKWGYMFCRGRIFSTLEKDNGQYDKPIEVFWASGGCLFVRAEAYHKVGGLDPDFFAHMEEIDLCWRLKNSGYSIGVVPQSEVFHVGGSVISYGSPQKTFYNFRNNLVLLLKNEESSKLVWLLPWRLVLDGVAGVQFLIKGDFKNILAIIRAHFSFYATFSMWYKKRKASQKLITFRNKEGIYTKSIIWGYFVKGYKYFSQIPFLTRPL